MSLRVNTQVGVENRIVSRRVISVVILCFLLPASFPNRACAQKADTQKSANLPRVFSLPAAALEQLRLDISEGKVKDPAVERLRQDADAALTQKTLSVMDKSIVPPSADKHDYMSQGPYWWPDPTKPNGLPYIRHDGETNPEIERIPDHKSFSKLISTVHTLALAYYLLGDASSAAHASALLRTWFLAPQTRMNPNLEFAQGIPGRNTGRGIGLIETRGMYRLVDAVGMLSGSKSWTAEDQKGMEGWCAKFLDWEVGSQHGKDESAAKNNHGTYYDVQVAALALFVGKKDFARSVLQSIGERRIAMQIEPDGRQPLELARTKALGYSTMNLAGLFELALLGDNVGVDIWNFQTSDGRRIRKALDYLIPYVSGNAKWPYQQIVEYKVGEFSPLLVLAALKFKEPRYEELAAKLDPGMPERIDLLPFRWGQAK